MVGNTFGHLIEQRLVDRQVRQLSRAVESSPTSIVITDTLGDIEYVNPKFTQVTGYSAEEVLGKNPRILKSGNTPPEVHRELWATIVSGHEWHGELCNRKKNGDLYWEFASISPVADANGTVTHYIALKEDITERRRIQEQLKRQNEYLSVLHEFTLDLLNRRELNDLLQTVVDRAVVLLDAPYGEIMLVEDDELAVHAVTGNQPFLKDDRVRRSEGELAWQAFDTGKPAVLEDYASWPRHRKIYDQTPMHAVIDFPVLAGDQCVGILAIGRSKPDYPFTVEQIESGILFARLVALVIDNANLYHSALQELAERTRAEARLQESEARYRQIVENASDVIYRTDANGYFTYINPPGVRIMGFDNASHILGKHYLELASPDFRHKLKRFYEHQFFSQAPSTYFEFTALGANGHEIWLGQNVQLIMEGEKVVGFQAVARDITDIKRAQEALAIARDQALEASRLKSQLLAKVSHELRTPLGGILGYAELLRDGAFGRLTAEQKDVTAQVVDSTNYLTTMVSELLDEAQIEAKSISLHLEPFSPTKLLEQVEDKLSVVTRNKGLLLEASIAPELPETIWGDERRLQQILINLVGNSIKFTKDGQVRVSLYAPDSEHWSIQVADTGTGIPEEARAYIFEPFRQVDNSITRENRGTGLGLSITKQLVELMEGQITLESEVGRGSTFTICLPIIKELEKKNV